VRFAPSPTGPLHIGGVRTALYNYLFAKQKGGDFIIRIEDTDSNRFVPESERYIFDSLRWCGIKADEGVEEGGTHTPYRQSERKEIYFQYAQQLVENGWAYYAFDTPEELDVIRAEYEARGETFSYNHMVRGNMTTSLRLPPEEVRRRIEHGDHWVIRFLTPENEQITMYDLIRGEVSVNSSTLDDKVLYKSADRLPTYHLANIVDDRLMDISHVIRGEEWLPSLPLHYLLYRAFGWSDTQPEFAHLPLLLKPVGQGKLSKRDGDKMGFPVFPLEWRSAEGEVSRGYREEGYLPEAFINMLALLGWNPGTEQEIFSMDDLAATFSLERVGKAGARFSPEKALWFNAQYIRSMPVERLAGLVLPIIESQGVNCSLSMAIKVVELVRERAVLLPDFRELSKFLFFAPTEYDRKVADKYWNDQIAASIEEIKRTVLEPIGDFTAMNIERSMAEWLERSGYSMGEIMNPLRLTIIGTSRGPSLYSICEIIGKESTMTRIDSALKRLQK